MNLSNCILQGNSKWCRLSCILSIAKNIYDEVKIENVELTKDVLDQDKDFVASLEKKFPSIKNRKGINNDDFKKLLEILNLSEKIIFPKNYNTNCFKDGYKINDIKNIKTNEYIMLQFNSNKDLDSVSKNRHFCVFINFENLHNSDVLNLFDPMKENKTKLTAKFQKKTIKVKKTNMENAYEIKEDPDGNGWFFYDKNFKLVRIIEISKK